MHKTASIIKTLLEDADTKSVHTILTGFLKNSGLYGYVLKQYSDKGILRIRQLRALGSFVNMIKSSDLSNPSIRLRDFMLEMKTREEHGLPVQGDLVTMTQEGVRIYTAHGSKGLEFSSVIIPFCLHNRNWPARMLPERIKLPPDLIRTKRTSSEKERIKELSLQDETRLFYVAMTRAKSDLIFTASPTENNISSLYLSRLDIERQSPQAGSQEIEEGAIERSLEAVVDLKGSFLGTEEVLRDMIGNMSLNPTRLNTYLYCRRKFLYNDVIRLPGAKKKSLVFGNCVHKALEDTYREYMVKKKFPSLSFFRDAFQCELKFQGIDRSTERELLEKMGKMSAWFEKASKASVMPIGLEKKLLITIGDNIIFTGKYDKVEWYDEKKSLVKIIDYKTGKPDKHLKAIGSTSDIADPECDGYLRQLVCYRLLFERDKSQSKGRRVASGELVFIEPVSEDMKRLGYKKGDYAVKSVEITDAMVSELEDLIKRSWKDIRRLKFEKLPSRNDDKCGHCDFDALCWGGEDE
ncbi:MAG: PD-(D/E)XK nuclease family protein [Candidatus Omnitrophica bacterium]|nr:PD-(D/E)XK nuclease family protein [Candidatus Omnitrophota bacterium]